MIYTKTSPVGVDVKINLIQAKIHDALLAFGILTGDMDIYGRSYRLRKDAEIIPVRYATELSKDLFSTDKTLVGYFYERIEQTNTNGMLTARLGNIFHVNLTKMYPSVTHRADAEFDKFIANIYRIEPYGFRLVDISRDVFADFNFETSKEDIPPFYSVRFDLNINFRI